MLGNLLGGSSGGGADKAIREQRKDNRYREGVIREMLGMANDATNKHLDYGDAYRTRVTNDALAHYGGSIVPSMDYFQRGNVGAQEILAIAPQQYQNALFGQPIDYSGLQTQQYALPDPATFQMSLPTVNPNAAQPQQSHTYQQPNQAPAVPLNTAMQAAQFAGGGSGTGQPGGGQAANWAALAAAIQQANKKNFPSDGLSPAGQVHTYAQLGENMWNNGVKKPAEAFAGAVDRGVASLADFLGGLR